MASSQPARPAMAPARTKVDDDQPVDLDAGAEGGNGIAADHRDMAAEGRLGHDEGEEDETGDGDPGDERDVEPPSRCR